MTTEHNWFELGQLDCYQDRCENCPFASIGGLESRLNPQMPKYVPEHRKDIWLDGYLNQALNLYGKDWATCEFSWRKAITIEANK